MSENQLAWKVENGNVLVLEQTFDAPRDVVFSMFSKEEHLKRWWSPGGWEITSSTMDFREGGMWHYCMKCVDPDQGDLLGMESWNKAVYGEIHEPERISYVDSWADAEGNVNESMPSTKITTEFIDADGRTKVVSRSEYSSADALKAVLDMGVIDGVSSTWGQLATYLNEITRS